MATVNHTEQKLRIRHAIRSLEEGLPYADHGAYGQDKARIAELQEQLRKLEREEQANGVC